MFVTEGWLQAISALLFCITALGTELLFMVGHTQCPLLFESPGLFGYAWFSLPLALLLPGLTFSSLIMLFSVLYEKRKSRNG